MVHHCEGWLASAIYWWFTSLQCPGNNFYCISSSGLAMSVQDEVLKPTMTNNRYTLVPWKCIIGRTGVHGQQLHLSAIHFFFFFLNIFDTIAE